MEDELFGLVYQLLLSIGGPRRGKRVQFSDVRVAAVYLWSVLNDRPMSWVCGAGSRRPRGFEDSPWPSVSTLSRRLRTSSVVALLDQMESHLLSLQNFSSLLLGVYVIDAKPLRVSDYSKDRHAGWGWGYRTKAKGYKLFMLVNTRGHLIAWRLGKMCDDERTIGRRLIRQRPLRPGYLIGDRKYDANPFYTIAAGNDLQLVAPRPAVHVGKGVSNNGCHPTRHRAIELLESGLHAFGPRLYALRTGIERKASTLCCRSYGLKDLPTWIRTYPRVRRYVQAKLITHLTADQCQHLRPR